MNRTDAPILEHTGRKEALIEPSRLLGRQEGFPRRAVLCFFKEIIDEEAAEGRLTELTQLHGEGVPIDVYRATASDVAVAFPGVTAPYAAVTMEELAAMGARAFVIAGGAGVLDGTIPPGRVIIPTRALRDEGTSYHYLPPSRWSYPHEAVVPLLESVCEERGVEVETGPTWTTDGVFRETREIISLRKEEGCLTVEMEASALFAVGAFRDLLVGQYLYAGDDVSGDTWQHRGWIDLTETRRLLFDCAMEAVTRLPLEEETADTAERSV